MVQISMRELTPIIRINALAGGGLGLVVGLLNVWLAQQSSWISIGLALGYVLLTQRWVAKPLQNPPWKQERKGSFKQQEPSRKELFRWTLTVTLTAITSQVTAFLAVYTVTALLMATVMGG